MRTTAFAAHTRTPLRFDGRSGGTIPSRPCEPVPKNGFNFRVFSFIQNKEDLLKAYAVVADQKPLLFHTALNPRMKTQIKQLAKRQGLHVYDLTGGAMKFLEEASGLRSSPNPAGLHELNKEYEQRIKSLDFTVSHDDGMNDDTLDEADIILLGVSRTSKTPTSIYLAYKGYKVANVPLVPALALPERALRRGRSRTVGLTIDPEKLREIRLRRAHEECIPGTDYASLVVIKREQEYADSLFLELDCPTVDVTNHAVEETAALVLKALHLR